MVDDAPLAVLVPSPLRRGVVIVLLGAMGAMLLWAALTASVGGAVGLALGGLGVVLVAGAEAVRRGTSARVELTPGGLRESGGRMLAPLDAIVSVDRGPFAVKPSGGFVVRLAERAPGGWAPGLWWRFGRRLGVGGLTHSHAGKAMADRLALLLAERAADPAQAAVPSAQSQ